MPDIKTRDAIPKTIKTLNRSAIAAEHAKDAFIRTKEKAEDSVYAANDSPDGYAADHISEAVKSTGNEAVYQFDRQGRKAVRTTKDNIMKMKEHVQQKQAEQAKKQAGKRAAQNAKRTGSSVQSPSVKSTVKSSGQVSKTAIKTTEKTAQTSIKTADRTAKATIKTSEHTAKTAVKTAEHTARVSIKTAEQTAKEAQKTAQASAKAAKATAQTAKAAARATVAGIKAVGKAIAATVKAIIAATKALIAAIAAGGWVAVVVIVILCLIGLIAGSCFGIFFSGEDSGNGQSMPVAVREINTDYNTQLDTIKSSIDYDVLEMSGSRALWPEVLSVYAVKTTTDPEEAQEVATMDASKLALLKDIFWQMNEISSRTETKTETVINESDDGHGNIVETTETLTETYLYIVVSHKTAEEMADYFNFSTEQRKQLAELLDEKNRSMWSSVLYGIGTGDGEIVTVALSQIGNVGGEPYWSWYGFGSRVEWCACFVSWCANECGYIDAGVIPKFAGCVNGAAWFQERGLWQDNSYEPRPGDIIFFDWDSPNGSSGPQDGHSDHVGIVEKVEDGVVYTVEGNSGDSCRERHYPIGYYEIYGYGTPAY